MRQHGQVTEQPSTSPTIERLVAYLIDGSRPDPALADLPAWLAATPRFRSFAETNRDKIRKKLRHATDGPTRLDVRAELRVAALLLADRRFELEFEAYGAGRRGPDFTATFRAGRPFNVEITRRRTVQGPASLESTILAKLRQLPASTANVLVIAVDEKRGAPDPAPVIHDLRIRADRHEDAFFAARGQGGQGGPGGAAAFHAGLLRLAAVLTWAETAETAARVAFWANPGARILLPDATFRALRAALAL
jgi:hypothetical protein